MYYQMHAQNYNLTNGTIIELFDSSTALGLKESQLNTGEKYYHSCNKIFCGWDYSLAQEKGAKYKHKNIYDEITVRHSVLSPVATATIGIISTVCCFSLI